MNSEMKESGGQPAGVPPDGGQPRPNAKQQRTETTERIVRNSDNDNLLPWGNQKSVVGYVNEVNGPGAEEIAGYVPTQHELVQLVKYWYRRTLDDSWSFFLDGCTGSTEWRVAEFANRRFERAEAVIGAEAVVEAIKEVRGEFKAEVKDDRLWDIFENGTEEQRDAVLKETERNLR